MAEMPMISSTPLNRLRGKTFRRFPQGLIETYSQLFDPPLDPLENSGLQCSPSGPLRGRLFDFGRKPIEWKHLRSARKFPAPTSSTSVENQLNGNCSALNSELLSSTSTSVENQLNGNLRRWQFPLTLCTSTSVENQLNGSPLLKAATIVDSPSTSVENQLNGNSRPDRVPVVIGLRLRSKTN
jgi:hypothetical protein